MPTLACNQFLTKIGAQQFVRVICAWCGTMILDGPEELPISHGMCSHCQETFGFELEGDDDETAA